MRERLKEGKDKENNIKMLGTSELRMPEDQY